MKKAAMKTETCVLYTHIESPIGPILLTATPDGTALTGLYMNEHKHGAEVADNWKHAPDAPVLAEAARQLATYFAGTCQTFDIPLAPTGTEFQKTVWKELQNIGYGETISYGELARRIGNPNAVRAVGLANGRNPLSIVVPCHRVIGADGKLVGYGGGMERKKRLLAFENRVRQSGPYDFPSSIEPQNGDLFTSAGEREP